MVDTTKKALLWVTSLLDRLEIPFQITGGLAAISYGSQRKLYDIDLDIPDDCFEKLKSEIHPYLIWGPGQFEDEHMSLLLMTAKFDDQLIDISGGCDFKIFSKNTNQWEAYPTDFSSPEMKVLYGIRLPILPLDKLIFYKTALSREVDLLDIEQLIRKSAHRIS